MATRIDIRNGVATCVYDDRFRPLLEALGVMEVHRASEVEFNPQTGEWEAKLLATGEIIASGINRNDVITAEVTWLEGNHVSHRND
jgi:hypothetical protein